MNLLNWCICSPYFCSLFSCSCSFCVPCSCSYSQAHVFPLFMGGAGLLLAACGRASLSLVESERPRPCGGQWPLHTTGLSRSKWAPGLFIIWFQASMSSLVLYNKFSFASQKPYKWTVMSSPVRIFSLYHQSILYVYLKPLTFPICEVDKKVKHKKCRYFIGITFL